MSFSMPILRVDELNGITRKHKPENATQTWRETLSEIESLWKRLVHTVHHPATSDKHMTASCNAICFVVRTASRSSNKNVKDFALSKVVWDDVFAASRSAFASGKYKPALQVLDTLAYLAESSCDPEMARQCVSEAIGEMTRIIFGQQPRRALKEACIVLYFFLRKLSDIMSFPDVLQYAYLDTKLIFLRRCHALGITATTLSRPVDQCWFAFVLSLLMVVNVAESKSATLKLLSLLCSLPTKELHVDIINVVHQAMDCYGASIQASTEDVTKEVLPSILTSKDQFSAFLTKSSRASLKSHSTVQLVLAQLKYGKSRGYLLEDDLPSVINASFFNHNQHTQLHGEAKYEGCRLLLRNASSAIRQSTCELLTFSVSPKTTVPSAALNCIADSLEYLHDDLDAYYRGELLSTWRRFLARLRQCRSVLSKQNDVSMSDGCGYIDHFFKRYLMFLRAELAPDLSYSRRILALDLLCFILGAYRSDDDVLLQYILADVVLQHSLFRLILDPYDDIRSTSAKALSYIATTNPVSDKSGTLQVGKLVGLLNVARKIAAATSRADHADAAGRLLCLSSTISTYTANTTNTDLEHDEIYDLAQEVCAYTGAMAELRPSTSYPLHGNILGLSYMIRGRKHIPIATKSSLLKDLLIRICSQIWGLSHDPLCVDSPEVEDESIDESTNFGPKDLLAYAWRALRDSNLLMQAMIECFETEKSLVKTIGEMCFDQLRLLRHRGAFSTVSQTFLLCCQKAHSADNDTFRQLTNNWFNKAMMEIEYQAAKLTRRSAGLPAMFAGLLNASDTFRFSAAFEALVKLAVQNHNNIEFKNSHGHVYLPQVHALNCIKDIMTNSRFRIITEPLVVLTINIAAQCLGSPIWAIKNCGLMLLRASINRLDPDTGLGAAEAGYHISRSLVDIESPLNVSLMLLGQPLITKNKEYESSLTQSKDKQQEGSNTEAEFAALDLLGRLYVSDIDRTGVEEAVEKRLSHSLWHIRAQAARVLANMAAPSSELALINKLFHRLDDEDVGGNESHGILMTIQNLLPKIQDNIDIRESVLDIVEMLSQSLQSPKLLRRPVVGAVLIEIVNYLSDLPTTDSASIAKMYAALKGSLRDLLRQETQLAALLQRAYAAFLIRICSYDLPDSIDEAVLILGKDEDTVVAVLSHLLSPYPFRTGAGAVDVLVQILDGMSVQDVQALVMNAIISISSQNTQVLSEMQAQSLAKHVKFGIHLSRDLLSAHLRMYAFLCAQAWHLRTQGVTSELMKLRTGFILHLRTSTNDSIDDSTRRGAATSLQELTRLNNASQMIQAMFGDAGKLEVMSVLYDLLNDDDDEIRVSSAEIAAHFIDPAASNISAAEKLSAMASRVSLRMQLLKEFTTSRVLACECLRRLLDVKTIASSIHFGSATQNQIEQYPVAEELQHILAKANDLFAEEKQNLYVDDIAEVKVWAAMLCSIKVESQSTLMTAVKVWVMNGVSSLIDFLNKSVDNVQIAYNLDLELLLVRVVTMARVVDICETELQELQNKCTAVDLSVSVQAAFTWSLR